LPKLAFLPPTGRNKGFLGVLKNDYENNKQTLPLYVNRALLNESVHLPLHQKAVQ